MELPSALRAKSLSLPDLSGAYHVPVAWKALILFAVALIGRVVFLEIVGLDYTGWYTDTYHYWQIAFYTLHIGLAQSPPRMWDLGGQEYFWGSLPIVTESLLLYLFNTTTLMPYRIFDTIAGSTSVVLVYFMGRQYFSDGIGLVAGAAAALSPVLWEVDTSGMLDPMGITLLFLALFLYRKTNYWTGFLLALACLVNVEFWFLGLAMILLYLVVERSLTGFTRAFAGWLTVMIPYFYVLRVQTGDFLYPLRYNFLPSVGVANMLGTTVPLQAQILPRAVSIVLLLVASRYAIKFTIEKPRSYPANGLFLSRIGMQGVIFGLTSYVIPYIAFGQFPRVLIDQLFALEYYYLPIVVVLIILQFYRRVRETRDHMNRSLFFYRGKRPRAQAQAPLRPETRGRLAGILMILLVFNASLVPFVAHEYYATYGSYQYQLQMADFITSHYRGGTVVDSLVTVNYRLINNGIPYGDILGTLHCPAEGGAAGRDWLIKNNVTWVIADQNLETCYPSLQGVATAPFHLVFGTQVYSVNQQEILGNP
jgi:hypothetical protein